mmetsp:Transcript_3018/g.5687  ORF Transcript_3018/g.5687 Transcript_3018/m.5687 type:complete len:86 (-) Transcript_3018:100-357(-)
MEALSIKAAIHHGAIHQSCNSTESICVKQSSTATDKTNTSIKTASIEASIHQSRNLLGTRQGYFVIMVKHIFLFLILLQKVQNMT